MNSEATSTWPCAQHVQQKNSSIVVQSGVIYLNDFKDLDQAEAFFRQAVALDDQQATAFYYLGETCLRRGDLDQAKQYFIQAVERKPDWQAPQDRLTTLENK